MSCGSIWTDTLRDGLDRSGCGGLYMLATLVSYELPLTSRFGIDSFPCVDIVKRISTRVS
jgi:hypothetical protein